MGIKNLNKVLAENKNIISKNNNKDYFKEVINAVTKGEKDLSKFVIHVDTSLIIYKHLFGGNDMESVYQTIKNGVENIKKNKNKIIFYSEPTRNKRKSDTHSKRQQIQDRTQLKVNSNIDLILKKYIILKKPIPEKIVQQEISTICADIIEEDKLNNQLGLALPELDTKFLNLFTFDKESSDKKDYKTYCEELEYFSNNDIYKKGTITSEDSLFDIGEEEFDIGEEDFDTLSSNVKEEESDDDTLASLKHEYTVLKDRKQLFIGFLMNNPMVFHKKYITDRLIKEKVISENDVVESDFLDAELNIIKNIRNKYIKYNNVIISVDQDCLLFGLHHIEKGVFFMKEKLSSDPKDITFVLNTQLSKNVALITSFFNESDYFKGLTKTTVTPIRIRNFLSMYSEIMNDTFELRDLIAIYTKWFLKSSKKMVKTELVVQQHDKVEKYFNTFNAFLNLEESFFIHPDTNAELTIEELNSYFLNLNPELPYINILGNRVNKFYTSEHL